MTCCCKQMPPAGDTTPQHSQGHWGERGTKRRNEINARQSGHLLQQEGVSGTQCTQGISSAAQGEIGGFGGRLQCFESPGLRGWNRSPRLDGLPKGKEGFQSTSCSSVSAWHTPHVHTVRHAVVQTNLGAEEKSLRVRWKRAEEKELN